MKKKTIAMTVAALLILVLALAGCGQGKGNQSGQAGGQAAGQLQTVNVAFDDSVGEAGVILGDQLGFFKQQGIKINFVHFNSGADELTSLASGQVDVSRGIIAANLFNASAKGIGIKLVADGGTNIPGRGYFELALKKELAPKIKDYKDLKGLRIAIASKGSINQLLLDMALAKGGLTDKDVQLVVVDSFPDMLTAVANNSADGCMQIDPLITKGVQQGILSWWKDASDYAAGEEISVVMYSPQFAAKKDLADRFMVAYLQGVRAYDDALVYGSKDRDKIVNILCQKTFLHDPKVMVTMHPPGLDPDGVIPKAGVVHDQNWYMQQGLVKKAADVDQLVDPSFANYAVQKLGKYKKPA
ncbi:ABC transporter substrate-binding protein [Desulfotomaculum copahuensis]|nr:ABC transporter substrate-binding protein [Desulfotomaculum copahuensis]